MAEPENPIEQLYDPDAPRPPRSRLLVPGWMLLGVGASAPLFRNTVVGMQPGAPSASLLALADWMAVLMVAGLVLVVIGIRRTRRMRREARPPAA